MDSLRTNDEFQSSQFDSSIVAQRPKIDAQGSKNLLHDANNDWLSKAKNRNFKAQNQPLEAQNLLS